jgi:hypothetical protein
MKHVLVAFWFVAIGLAAGNAWGEDRETTSVVYFDGTETKTVALVRFDPLSYLMHRLPGLPEPNAAIVTTLLSYPRDGTHRYWWPRRDEPSYDGCTTHVLYRGERVMTGEPGGQTYCCGLTLEVLYRVLESEEQRVPWLTTETTGLFKHLWFCREKNSLGPTEALETFGIGRRITDDAEVLPGDFVQIWRHNGTGHSVVFVGWAITPDGEVAGIHYWSTQPRTNGIHFATETFGNSGEAVDRKRTGFARLLSPGEWREVDPVAQAREQFGVTLDPVTANKPATR